MKHVSFQDNYGRTDQDCVLRIKQLYKDLDLEGVYRQYEEESYCQLMATIEKETRNNPCLPPAMFHEFAARIYKRKSWKKVESNPANSPVYIDSYFFHFSQFHHTQF